MALMSKVCELYIWLDHCTGQLPTIIHLPNANGRCAHNRLLLLQWLAWDNPQEVLLYWQSLLLYWLHKVWLVQSPSDTSLHLSIKKQVNTLRHNGCSTKLALSKKQGLGVSKCQLVRNSGKGKALRACVPLATGASVKIYIGSRLHSASWAACNSEAAQAEWKLGAGASWTAPSCLSQQALVQHFFSVQDDPLSRGNKQYDLW